MIGWWPSLRATVADKPNDESRLGLARHLLEAVRRQVMAFVDDHVAVVGDAIIDDTLPDEALNDGDVEQPGRSASPAADSTDRLRGHAEERREPLDPLVEQLPPMHEHERVDAALGDEPGGDDGLAERGRGGQHAGLVRQHRVCRRLLLGPELALKASRPEGGRRSARRE